MSMSLVSDGVLRSLALIMIVSLATGVSGALPRETHPFGLDDYSALRQAHAVSVSPDGKTILYVVSHDGDKGPSKDEWRLIEVSGENSRKLELPGNFRPAGFVKDGAALFGVYEVEKKAQLAIVPLASGEATKIIAMPNGIRGAVISPDGMRFAILADPRPSDALAEVRHVAENDVTSIYVAGVSGGEGSWWRPELKYVVDVAWALDSSQIAVVTQTPKIGNHDFRSSVYVCGASGSRRVAEIPTAASGIAWADGGKTLAFASTTTDVLTPDHLWTAPVSGGKPVDRTPKLEGSIMGVWGDPRGNVWAEMHRGTVSEIYAYCGSVQRRLACIRSFTVASDFRMNKTGIPSQGSDSVGNTSLHGAGSSRSLMLRNHTSLP